MNYIYLFKYSRLIFVAEHTPTHNEEKADADEAQQTGGFHQGAMVETSGEVFVPGADALPTIDHNPVDFFMWMMMTGTSSLMMLKQ